MQGYKSGDMAIEKTVKNCYGDPLPMKVKNLKAWKAYVVAVKFNQQNMAHRAVMFTKGYQIGNNWILSDTIELHSDGYEHIEIQKLSEIYWLKVINEIKSLDRRAYYDDEN